MQKIISINLQNTVVDFLFYQYDETDAVNKAMFHKRLNYEMHFCTDGSYEYELADRKVVLCKNEMLIIPPGILHKSVETSKDRYAFLIGAANSVLYAVSYVKMSLYSTASSEYLFFDNCISVFGIVSSVLCLLRFKEYVYLQVFGTVISFVTFLIMLNAERVR